MVRRNCDVNGCPSHISEVPLHAFPSSAERAIIWKQFCQNPNLKAVPLEKLFRKAAICRKHFAHEQYTTTACLRLNRNALPSLLPPSSFLFSSTFESTSASVAPPPGFSTPLHSASDIFSPTFESTSAAVTPPGTSTPLHSASDILSRPHSTLRQGVRKSILADIGMTRLVEMTPRKRVIYHKLLKDKRRIAHWKKLAIKCKTDINRIQSDMRLFHDLETSLSPSAITILISILRAGKKKPKGRRWSDREKVIALSIFKQSPKTYRVLRSLFPLPSKRTLAKFLSKIPLLPGINQAIFQHLASYVEKMPERDRYCTLMFDEMAIKPQLVYVPHMDLIVGYEDHGNEKRRNVVAKVAMVFMVRGVWASWKQPLAYYLSAGATSSSSLKWMIQELLNSLKGVGLKVIATVCDMGTNNVKALKLMGATYANPFFDHGGQTIVTIYDPPHLLKCFRNLLLKYDIKVPVTVAGQEVFLKASWKHLRQLYEDDGKNPHGRMYHLTENHLNPKGYLKMRVKLAAQVFSRLVGLGLSGLVAKGLMENDGLATSEVCLSINNLFDSLNSDENCKVDERRKLKLPITRKSHHHQLFVEMYHKIGQWPVEAESGKQVQPPSQKGWLATIKGVQLLWQHFKDISKFFSTRSLNQDPVENLFNVVRQNCGCNHQPNASMFMGALKTSIVNGLLSSSMKGNCEDDGSRMLLDNNDILSNVFSAEATTAESHRLPESLRKTSSAHLGSIPFIAAGVAEDVRKLISCMVCQSSITSYTVPPLESCITLELSDNCSISPSEEFIKVIEQCIEACKVIMEGCCHKQSICHRLVTGMRGKIDFSFLRCSQHREKVADAILHSVCLICIRQHCARVAV